MAYSGEILSRARQRLASEKADRESAYLDRLFTAYAKVPEIKEIDLKLRQSMTLAAQTVFANGGDAASAMEQVKDANLALQKRRRELVEANFAPDFLDEKPVCSLCGGAGYIGSAMCSCLEEFCRQEQVKALGGLTTGTESFGNFRLDYYPQQVDARFGVSPRAVMEKVLRSCKKYAEDFGTGENLLFIGGTGLGKTFLSACVANAVAEKGYSVCYESAGSLFGKLEKNRFDADADSESAAKEFAQCDLLIIDDLGTEISGNFVTSSLYTLLNDRLLAGKSMLLSTNLNIDEIARRYNPQIASRLQGNFKNLTFIGDDIRVMKNRG